MHAWGDRSVNELHEQIREANGTKRPFWMGRSGKVQDLVPVPSTRDEVEGHLEAVILDLATTPGQLQSYDRVVFTSRPDQGYRKEVYVRHAVSGQWFSFEFNVCTTDIPDGSEWDDTMGQFVSE